MFVSHYRSIRTIYKNFLPLKNTFVGFTRTCSNISLSEIPNYDEVDKKYILNILNENSTNELSRFAISKARLKKLEQWRTKKGKFESVDDVLEVDGFGIKVLQKFYTSILDIRDNKIKTNGVSKSINTKKLLNFITPTLEARQNISQMVAVHMNVNAVSWCVLKSNVTSLAIENWGLHDFASENKKMHIAQMLQLAISINKLLPSGDMYIFEAPQGSLNNSSTNQKSYVAKTDKLQLLSMIISLLASRTQNFSQTENDSNDFSNVTYENFDEKREYNNIYFLRNMLPARLYRTIVGNERISTESVINNFFKSSNTPSNANEIVTNPIISPKLVELYKSLTPVHKELFGHALLLGMTCARICILQDKESIQKLYNRS